MKARYVLVAGVLLVVLTAGAAVAWRSLGAALATDKAFAREHLFDAYFLNDLGVADVDDDGRLDVFTTNHSARQHIVLGRGDGTFSGDMVSALGLDQTVAFPGLAAGPTLPGPDAPGLWLSLYYSAIALQFRTDGGAGGGRGEISFPWPATVASTGAAAVELSRESRSGGLDSTRIAFDFAGDGEVMIEPQPAPSDGFPIRVELLDGLTPADVRVGADAARPTERSFMLTPKDRHAMAWADVTGDGTTDVFIARGGLRGLASQFAAENDELLLGDGGRLRDRTAGSGIAKDGCPGRQAAWVDVDRDNRLDLYLSCGRTGGAAADAPNRLYRQRADGSFEEVAQALGVADPGYGGFVWFDVDGDGAPDLLSAGRRHFVLYRNQPGGFVAEVVTESPSGPASRLRKLTVGDFDADGDLDVFVASRDGNFLLVNEAGSLRAEQPTGHGLPEASHSAVWIDYDNDGRLDLAAVPDGIYRQQAAGSFAATGLLRGTPALAVNDARAAWFDADLDGALDAVIAIRPCWPGRLCAAEERGLALLRRWLEGWLELRPPDFLFASMHWVVDFYRGRPGDGHWLAIDVVGPPGNRPSIGARVAVGTTSRTLIAEVGQLDGAHYSQGNYRLHFGLGGDRATAVEARWPDGTVATLQDPAVDSLIRIDHPANG